MPGQRGHTPLKLSIVLGTRPEIIKMSPVIRECERQGVSFFVLHTGQHYSYNMDRIFFEQIRLPDANYNLDVGSGSHGEQTARMLDGIERILRQENPDIVLVEGDTNTVLAGGLTAAKLGIKVGHVEAGLRSYDRRMPEEINRIIVDHCSDYLFAPTEKSREILRGEGVSGEKIFVVGNTIVDAVLQNLEISRRTRNILDELDLETHDYFVATAHRQENVDNETRLRGIIRGLELVRKEFDSEVIYPVHPRAQKRLKEFSLNPGGVRLVDPLDYLGFLQLESNASLVLTDSGGVQEEACVLRVPCVTLRENTERPETLEAGSNILAGTDPHEIMAKTKIMLGRGKGWDNPFGDGRAAERIVEIVKKDYQSSLEMKKTREASLRDGSLSS